ncbi:MAG: cyclase family protein [Planctomycetia bacterium]|nr:cyclase family protein [Planctomycetia bacterium]
MKDSHLKLVDLSRRIEEGMSVYPGDPLFGAETVASHNWDGYHVSQWSIGSHLGTHIDVPFHYFSDGETADQIPLDYFYGPASVIDLRPALLEQYQKTNRIPAQIEPKMLYPFESQFEKANKIILKTGWEAHIAASDYYFAFPALLPETADWIADYPIHLLGLETPSLSSLPYLKNEESPESESEEESDSNDFRQNIIPLYSDQSSENTLRSREEGREVPLDEITLHSDAEAHRILLGRRPPVLILEGLVNLDRLPSEFILSCFPLSVVCADGSPVRAVGLVQEDWADQIIPLNSR